MLIRLVLVYLLDVCFSELDAGGDCSTNDAFCKTGTVCEAVGGGTKTCSKHEKKITVCGLPTNQTVGK